MRQIGLSILLALCTLPVSAQESTDEKINNTGAPDLLGGGIFEMPTMTEMPESIQVTNDGTIDFNAEQDTYTFEGKVRVVGDNDLTLNAHKAVIQAKEETAVLTGHVAVRQKSVTEPGGRIIPGIQLFADKVLLNAKTNIIILDGNVSIYQGPTLQRGDHAVYNYATKQLEAQGLTSKLGPIIMESERLKMVERNGEKVYLTENTGITTHDVANPNYWIRSGQTTIYPNDRIIFKNLRLYAGETPIFWFPYLSQPLDADLGLHLIPGAKSNWGGFLLSSYGIMLGGERNEDTGERENAWLLSKWHFDVLSKRGVGAGLDLFDTRIENDENLGWMKYYYLNDRNPSLERSDEPRGFVNEDRWKFELKYRHNLYKHGNSQTYADINIMPLSDRYFLEDFEPGIFKVNPSPNNEVGLFQRNPRYLLGLYTRLRLNDFYESDTRLPELFLDQIKAPIFNSPILHESQTTLGIYKEYMADYDKRNLQDQASTLLPGDPLLTEINNRLEDRGFSRFHTWHEFTLPLNLDGKITIVPRAGAGITSYWDIEDGSDNVTRTHLGAGVDASMKFSKVYPDIQSEAWGLDSLMHVIQPYANFSQLTTNHLDSTFRGIDVLSPSTRPPPLEVGRFPATDDLTNWTILRLGGRNNLLTKRDGQTHNWFSMNTYIDVFLNDLEADRALSNLYNELTWAPLPWMEFDLETQFPIAQNSANFTEIAGYLSFLPHESAELQVGYRYLDNHPTLQNSNRIDLRTYLRINHLWGVGTYHRFELDDDTLEVQQYAIHHDFDSWRTSLGFLIRDNREESNEYGLMLNFTLKNFPAVRMPLSIDSE